MPTARNNDSLILAALETMDGRLSRYDTKFDVFTINFNEKVSELDRKITAKVETIICTTKDVEKLSEEVAVVKAMMDPENRKARYFALITGLLALMNLLQLFWGNIARLFGPTVHP